jgi:hypothetical protein
VWLDTVTSLEARPEATPWLLPLQQQAEASQREDGLLDERYLGPTTSDNVQPLPAGCCFRAWEPLAEARVRLWCRHGGAAVDPGPPPEPLARGPELIRDPGLVRLGEVDISLDDTLGVLKVDG